MKDINTIVLNWFCFRIQTLDINPVPVGLMSNVWILKQNAQCTTIQKFGVL